MNMEKYKTSDLGLASALMTIGYNVVEIDKTNVKKMLFVFKDSENLQEDINNYWNRKLEVEPTEYFNSMKALKTRIYD